MGPNQKDGWHDFTLEQAKDYLAETKAHYPRAWTGIYRCAEEMTELAEKSANRLKEAESLLKQARKYWPDGYGDSYLRSIDSFFTRDVDTPKRSLHED